MSPDSAPKHARLQEKRTMPRTDYTTQDARFFAQHDCYSQLPKELTARCVVGGMTFPLQDLDTDDLPRVGVRRDFICDDCRCALDSTSMFPLTGASCAMLNHNVWRSVQYQH